MKQVLIVDDSSTIRKVYKKILLDKNINCLEAENGLNALEILTSNYKTIKTILVDQDMPVMNGMEFLKCIKSNKKLMEIPVIFVSAISDNHLIKDTLNLGVYDYLIKPIDNDIFYLKVNNSIEAYEKDLSLKEVNKLIISKNNDLENKVKERTEEVNEMLYALLNALENANYYNDNDTGKHARRVARFSEFIASKYGLDSHYISQIKLFASIHDIGKVGVNPYIIKKPGKLTSEEFEQIKTHVDIGYKMLKDAPISIIAKNIIRYHHERWNGKGYTSGLKGEEIPLEARIVAVSDVFDALVNSRTYKDAFPKEKVISILKEEAGNGLQVELVDIVLDNIDEMLKLNKNT